jgi:hypothetical protein
MNHDPFFHQEVDSQEQGINIQGSSAFPGFLASILQAKKYGFEMDEGGKTTDQKIFEALVFICPHFDHFRSSRGLIDVSHSGRNPRPEKDAPACRSFKNGVRKNG